MMPAANGKPGTVLVAAALLGGLCWIAWMRLDRSVDASFVDRGRAEAALPDMRIDLNAADAAQIGLLPGIGPRLAHRIIEHRSAQGSFASIDDLDNVQGIGPRTLDAARPYLVIGGVESH